MAHIIFIISCISVIAIVWISTAFRTKRVAKRAGGWTLRIIAFIVVIGFLFLRKYSIENESVFSMVLWQKTPVSLLIADIVTFLGMCLMVWARRALGSNWSGDVVLKEEHELVTNGPYAYVRHPIYSGLLLVILGITIYSGSLIIIILFLAFVFGAYFKGLKEEKILIEYFGEKYLEYRKRTGALIPNFFNLTK